MAQMATETISNPKPLLTTARLELWKPRAADLNGLVELLAAEETRRFLGSMPAGHAGKFERLLRNAGSWSLYGYGNFIVRLHGTPDIIGICGVFHSWRGNEGLDDVPEAGWILRHDSVGLGYAGEAMRAALAWFEATFGAQRIACMIESGNAPSLRLADRLGFVQYGGEALEDEGGELRFFERLP